MKKEVIVSAPTIDEAIAKAAAELNVDKIDCSIEILETPRRAILFGKAKDAVIKATIEIEEPKASPRTEAVRTESSSPAAAPQKSVDTARSETAPTQPAAQPSKAEHTESSARPQRPKPEAGVCTAKVEIARGYLKSILDAMGLDEVTMSVTEEEEGATISFSGEGMAVLIGHHGETLDALQYLVALTCNRSDGEYYRISLDCGSYREKREVTLQALAGRIASKVKKTGRSQLLEPMNPYERRIIHAVVSEIEGVYSRSKGEEPNRRVVILSESPSRGFNRDSDRPQGDRRPGGRPQGRPQGGAKPQGDRRPGGRPQGDRPQAGGTGASQGSFNRDRDREIKPGNQHKPERSMEEILKSDFKKREESAELYSKIEL